MDKEIMDKTDINPEKIMFSIRENVRKKRLKEANSSDLYKNSKRTLLPFDDSENISDEVILLKTFSDISNKTYFISTHKPILGKLLVVGRNLVHGEVCRYVDPMISKQVSFNEYAVNLFEKTFDQINNINNAILKIQEQINLEIKATNFHNANEWNELKETNKDFIQNEIESRVKEIIDSKIDEMVSKDIENKVWLSNLLNKNIDQTKELCEEKEEFLDINYFIFNDLYGGTEQNQKEIYSQFLEYFNNCKNVLDIGCGRGVFLELLKEREIPSYGIECNEDLIFYCKRKGLTVILDDAISHLEKLKDKSLDGIFIAHVLEHLSSTEVYSIIKICYEKLQYGSYLVIATPNIQNILVSSNFFYLDPTHKNHLHPEVLKFFLNSSGYRNLKDIYYQPTATELKLKKIEVASNNKDNEEIRTTMNENIDRINNIIFSYRDYAVISKK
jgi:O-antigen chain-terminating methyltransferase